MSILATDDFAGSGALSASWTVDQGSAARSSGECAGTDTGTGQVTLRYTGVTTPNNHYAKLIVGSVKETVTDTGVGPTVRSQDASNMYFLQGNTNETRLWKKVAGSFTQLGSDGPSVTTGDELYLEIQGTQLIAKKNGSVICGSPTDSSLSTGRGGIWFGPDNAGLVLTVDNFEVGDFSAANIGLARKPGPGVSPDKASQFSTGVKGSTAGSPVSVSLTGQVMTFAHGSLTTSGGDQIYGQLKGTGPGISPDYTQLFRARRLGITVADVTISLSGQQMTLSQGSVTPQVSYSLTGQQIISAQGSVTPQVSYSLTGQAMTESQGSVVPQVLVGTAGQQINASQGTITTQTSGDVTVALSGQVISFFQGAISIAGGDVVDTSTGGWNFYVDFEQMLRKKRQRQQEQDEAAEIQNELDRNIARLLHEQIKKDEERAELERIRGLVQRYKSTVPVDISSVRVLKAIETAQQKETFASYLKLQQEVERMLEDEEEQFLMLLASFD